MGMLYRNSDLEVRFSMNMNVLIDGVTPKVCSMKEVLRAFLDFRREVLERRSLHRMEKIYHLLAWQAAVVRECINLGGVLDIIRKDDERKGFRYYLICKMKTPKIYGWCGSHRQPQHPQM